MTTDDLEDRFRELEKEVEQNPQVAPVVDSINLLTGWKKIAVVLVIGVVLFAVARALLSLVAALVSIALLGLIAYGLYKLFFESSRIK